MTREEIIEGLKLLEDNMVYFDELLNDKGEYIDVHELLFEAIEALEQEPCDDSIGRAEAMTEIMMFAGNVKPDEEDVFIKVSDAVQLLRELPPVTPKPKTGHWIIKEGREQGYDIAGIKTWYIQIMCDKCGFIKTAIEGHTGQYHFCPNCGAKMESEDKE